MKLAVAVVQRVKKEQKKKRGLEEKEEKKKKERGKKKKQNKGRFWRLTRIAKKISGHRMKKKKKYPSPLSSRLCLTSFLLDLNS